MVKQSFVMAAVTFTLLSSISFGMYNPKTGRFMQQDPYGTNPGGRGPNPFSVHRQYRDGINIYEYVGSSSVNKLDPMGTSIGNIDCALLHGVLAHFRVGGQATLDWISNKGWDNPDYPVPDIIEGLENAGLDATDEDWETLYWFLIDVLGLGNVAQLPDDKFTHCEVSCKISRKCGSLGTLIMGVLNELADTQGEGFDPSDIEANLTGVGCSYLACSFEILCGRPRIKCIPLGWPPVHISLSPTVDGCEACCGLKYDKYGNKNEAKSED